MFTHWKSIENHYNRKVIDKLILMNPQIRNESLVVTEKIHGANTSFSFDIDGTYKVYKKSGAADEGFYNWTEILSNSDIVIFLETVSSYCKTNQKCYQFVGELFGANVQKGIVYGPRSWRWYAIYEYDETGKAYLLTIKKSWMLWETIFGSSDFSFTTLHVPIIMDIPPIKEKDFIDTIQKEIDINRNSALTPIGHDNPNIIEGVVIRPLEHDYYYGDNEESTIFIIKYKNKQFMDRAHEKVEREPAVYSEVLSFLLDKGKEYINENRTNDLMSKEGEIKEMKQFGKYLGAYSNDFFKDFAKDYGEQMKSLEKVEQKEFNRVMNAIIAKELRRYISAEETE